MLGNRNDDLGRRSADPPGGIGEERREERLGCRVEPEQPRSRILEALDHLLDFAFVGRLGDEYVEA